MSSLPLGRRLLFAAIPALFVLGNGVVLAEWWLRRQQPAALDQQVLGPSPLSNPNHDQFACYEEHPLLGYVPRVGRCGRDARGLRFHDATAPDSPDPLRVLVLGDSIADQDLWVGWTRAAAEASLGAPLQAFNSGVPGYDTCSEVALLEERLLEVDPDALVLQFCLNDFEVSAAVLPLGDGRVRLHAGHTYEVPAWVLRSRLALFAMVKLGLGRGEEAALRKPTAPIDPCLDRLAEIAEERDIPVGVVLFPAFVSDPDSLSVPVAGAPMTVAEAEAHARALFDARDFSTVPLRPVLAASGPLEQQRNEPRDLWHPDKRTQKRIGDALGPFLAGLLGQSSR